MTYTLSEDLWPPQRRSVEAAIDAYNRGVDIVLQGPTGCGKTRIATELFAWAGHHGLRGCFYVNRKLLVGQTAQRFTSFGLDFGVRAADYDDFFRPGADFQICSADTEGSRVFKRKLWQPHEADWIIVDEAHIQKGETMKQIIADHKSRKAKIILLTATPVGLSGMADELVVSGTMKEYRDCGALVPAKVYSVEQPDLDKVKRNATGEFVMEGKKRKIYTQTIVAGVLENWKRHNPDARPTMMYAPGKPESVWLTEKFQDIGVNCCHVDATDAMLDGERRTLNRDLWDEILDRYRSGSIKILSSRFKLREGIDVPATYMCILATPIGSLASYIQTVGRVLRYSSDTPDHVIVTDHGGNYHRHGSPNDDRPWHDWWKLSEAAVSTAYQRGIRDHGEPEPIRCPECGGERKGGRRCPFCQFEHEKSKRRVIQENGELKDVDGQLIKPRVTKQFNNTEKLWEKMFWGYRKKKVNQSLEQMYNNFHREYHYWPPRTMRLMPIEVKGNPWRQKVHQVDIKDLR